MGDVTPADTLDEMYVTKRDGNQEIVSFDKILKRIKNLGQEANIKINYTALVMKVIDQLYDGISTTKIDELSAEQCASMASIHTDYNALAGRISISNHHKNTTPSFVNAMAELYSFLDKQGNHSPLVSQELYEIVCKYPTELEDMIVHDRDYLIDYFGFKTLDRAYLTRINKKTVERPQYMWLRVAIGIHGDNLEKIRETYDYMSQKCFTHATPTLFNAGTPRPQLSSCFEKNTPVNTLRGPIPIKDVKIGDEVITHLGNVKKVVQCHENKIGDRKLYSVFIHKTPEFIVTEDHKLFVYDKKTKTTNWKEVRHLSNSDYIMIPNYNGSIAKSEINVLDVILKHDLSKNDNKMTIELNDDKTRISLRTHWEHCNLNKGQQLCVSKNSTSIYNIISIDNDFMKFLGIWFGDGHIIVYNSKKNNNHRIRGIGFTIHKDNEKLVDFCIGMKDRFGIENVTVHKMKTQNVIQVLYNCPALGILFQELYGKGFAGKKLPDDFYKYDTNLITSFLSGLITTDGCVSASGAITLCMANKKLMFDLYSLCRIHNLDVSKPNPVKCQKLTKTQAYCMTLTNLRNDLVDIWKTYTDDRVVKTAKKPYIDAKRICADGFKYLRFQKRVEVEIDDEHVYTLGVEDDHSYSINGIIAQNCFLLSMEEDSIEGIFNTLKDCALISKLAGGIGLHIHNVRAKGSHIRGTNGSSNGIVPMLRVFNNTAKYVDQGGGKRNGSFAIYLEPWHADIESFLQMRKNHGDEELKARDLFYALWIPDLFMERVKADANWTLMCPNECPGLADVYGDEFVELYTKYEAEGKGRATVKARQLWFQVLDAQMETGTPYLLYKDACNKKSNQKNIGTIKSSNLCVSPETQILTDKGHLEIQQLAGQKANVWNGQEFSEVEVFQTGENQELMEVKTDDGCTLTCTPYHKFFIQNSYSKKSCQLIEAKDLKTGDKLQKCGYPVIDGKEKMKHAYTHGFFCGDGTYTNNHLEHKQCEWRSIDGHYFCKRHLGFETEDIKNNPNARADKCNAMSYVKKPVAYLYGEKKDLLEHMEYRTMTENDTRIVLQLPLDLDEKFYVPKNANLQDKLTWFAGYCDADGSIAVNGTNKQLQVASINPEFLFDVKMMLQTCGVNPKLRKMRDAATSYLPDGKGGHRDFTTQPVYRLLITSCDLIALKDLGFSPKRLKMENIVAPNRNVTQFVKIASATRLERRDNTFCFTEPKRHAGIFNGMLTSQCTEVVQVSNEEESAVCNLASIALPAFISSVDNSFDFEKLHKVSRIVTYNLNRVIDINYYPTEKTRRSNLRHRPIGIGVQGLADVFMILGFPFASDDARQLNKRIFETIYHAALEESCDLARRDGAYETFPGSPASQGILQYDMWNVEPEPGQYDWTSLKTEIQTHGLRNSLLLAPMPTASTSQILGYNECIEPITSNIYNRRTLAGEFILANKYLMQDLVKLDLWNEKIKNNIIANHGSVQHIESIPKEIREKYKTVWEIPMRALIDMAADRGAYVCQSQSLNLWLEDPTYSNLTSMHFYSWSKGLKTGIYYLRRRARHQAQQFTIEPEKKKGESASEEVCEMCSA